MQTPSPKATTTVTVTAPLTGKDMDALKARRDELSTQLQSVDRRRASLIKEMRRTSDPIATKGLETRLALLDGRQLQLESDLQQTGQQLSSLPAGLIASTSVAPTFGGFDSDQVMILSVLSILFVLFPLAVGVARAIWKRSSRPRGTPEPFAESAERLERLEASVDAIAIEIERVSEGQRFVTRLLSEGQPGPMLGAGQRARETAGGA